MKTTTKPRRRASSNGAAFAFSSAIPYADKGELIEKDLAFAVKAIEFQPERGFENQDRWAVTIVPNDGRGEELLTFGSNEKRDAQMKSAQAFVKKHGAIPDVRLRKSGKAYYLQSSSGSDAA